jgi:NhaP-type Na+/H+ or K+/H+ antiporter
VGGVLAGTIAAAIVVHGTARRFVDETWLQVVPLAASLLAFGFSEAIEGSGFIGAFVGGMVFGGMRRRRGGEVSHLTEQVGAILAAVTFVVFGAVLLGPALRDLTWQIALYAALSLTLVRMLPVAISMLGTGARRPTVAFLGWFGPRGAASIVFALLVLEEGGLVSEDLILTTAFVTVGLSVLAHGVSAAPLARRYADWHDARADETPVESGEESELRWRLQRE